MKKITLSLIAVVTALVTISQTPQAFKYQAVVRDNAGVIISNQNISFRISIHDETPAGTIVYQESHSIMTNEFGLANLEIGNGTPITGNLSGVNWGVNNKFLEVEMDPAGGSTYVSMGITQLLSVPYALYSETTGDTSMWRKTGDNVYYNTGRVGIGTTNPSTKLDVRGSAYINGPVYIGKNDSLEHSLDIFSAVSDWEIVAAGDTNRLLIRKWQGDTIMSLMGDGKVGIGTITPAYNLDISSNSTSSSRLRLTNVDHSKILLLGSGGNLFDPSITFQGAGALRFMKHDGMFIELMRIQDNGNVGIGTDAPDESAILELQSSSKGMLFPRLTTKQVEELPNPAEGLVIYNTDAKTISVFNGINWYNLGYGECIPQPTIANAGLDQTINNNDTAMLQGNIPIYGNGLWNIVTGEGGLFSDVQNPNSEFSGLSDTDYILKWTITTACDSSFDNVNIQFTNIDTAVFVSNTGSNANSGTKSDPFLTIDYAISQAQLQSKSAVNIAAGFYGETVHLDSDIGLYGGFNSTTWERDPLVYQTFINGGTKTIVGESVTNVTIHGLSIYSDDVVGFGESSYAVFLTNSTDIRIIENNINAGRGANGMAGANGLNGSAGGAGQNGTPGCEDGIITCSSCSMPVGGNGGNAPVGFTGGNGGNPGHGPDLGSPGIDGGGSPGTGGEGGSWPNTTSCTGGYINGYPANGLNGYDGNNGINGNGGVSFGSMTLAGYISSNGSDGINGNHGTGGGGGGGGAGGTSQCDSYGSSGGGGGGGGEAGERGYGGEGAGGSFGVWSYYSVIMVANCSIHTNSGGNGGNGGMGGMGATGGLGGQGGAYGGGTEQDDAGCGGWGGNGGDGGDSGHGGGGGGGPSICIVYTNGSLIQLGNSMSTAPSSNGGSSPGNAGQNGLSQSTYVD